jgi:hypothetical protein
MAGLYNVSLQVESYAITQSGCQAVTEDDGRSVVYGGGGLIPSQTNLHRWHGASCLGCFARGLEGYPRVAIVTHCHGHGCRV